MGEPKFFRNSADFRKWLEKHGETVSELLVGLHHLESGKGGLTYKQALDEALCCGWIDGVRRRYDDSSYTIRFTPRKPTSIWSVVNTNRMEELIQLDRVHPIGLKVYRERDARKSKLYSYEVRARTISPKFERQFRANSVAWKFYQEQAPWYRRVSCFWVVSAKKEETKLRRLHTLMEASANGRRIKQLTSNPKSKNKA